jgi:hypothetical protein
LGFLPEPQGHGSLRPTLVRRGSGPEWAAASRMRARIIRGIKDGCIAVPSRHPLRLVYGCMPLRAVFGDTGWPIRFRSAGAIRKLWFVHHHNAHPAGSMACVTSPTGWCGLAGLRLRCSQRAFAMALRTNAQRRYGARHLGRRDDMARLRSRALMRAIGSTVWPSITVTV